MALGWQPKKLRAGPRIPHSFATMLDSLQPLLNNLGLMTAALAIGASWVASIVSPNCSFDKLTGARADGHVRELIHRTSPQLGFLMAVSGALFLFAASWIAGIVSFVAAFGFYATRMMLAPKEGKNPHGVRTRRKEQRGTSVALSLTFTATALTAAVLGLFGI
jgi:hypothetical protein